MVSCGQHINLNTSSSSLVSSPPASIQPPVSSPGAWSGPGQPQDVPDAPNHSPERGASGVVGNNGEQFQTPPHNLGHPRGPPGPGLIRGVTRGSVIRPPIGPHGPGLEYGSFIRPMPIRPPFFIREIYKNGFLKRLPYNEKKSSALAKLMKSDRFWVVFSIHDDLHPFLELWHEPTEVATKPPQYIFPLAACQHISPSLIAADSEWSFVINFDTVAIRFSCNSREVMDDWVDVIRNKLGEMGILAIKGNLYSRTPLGPPVTKPVIRDPTSPLPQPPESQQGAPSTETNSSPSTSIVASSSSTSSTPSTSNAGGVTLRRSEEAINCSSNTKPKRGSLIDTNAGLNQTFTTSIYLNQTAAPKSPTKSKTNQSSLIVNRKTSLPVTMFQSKTKLSPSKSSVSQSQADLNLAVEDSDEVAISSAPITSGATSSVYLNQSSPTRHVTVIPINNDDKEDVTNTMTQTSLSDEAKTETEETTSGLGDSVEFENHTYGAIFDFDEKTISRTVQQEKEKSRRKSAVTDNKDVSPRRGRERSRQVSKQEEPPPLPDRPGAVLRRLSDRKHEVMEGHRANIQQRIRRKSRRSSSLGPLLDGNMFPNSDMEASTLSLESVDSNPRQALARSDRNLGAVPRRPLHPTTPGDNPPSPTHPLLGSPPRNMSDLPPGVRPPPYHPLAMSGHPPPGPPGSHPPPSGSAFPPMIPLPGLTCQLSGGHPPGPPVSLPPVPADDRGHQRSLREQQVFRLRQEISHPAGVRLQLRKKDVQSSLALVDLFGMVWVVGWKQRDYPVLFNAFHIGDQIISVSGVLIRSSSEFSKLVKLKSSDLHTEIIIRRAPFGQVFYLKPDIEGQSLGIILNNSTSEIKEIIPGSVASQAGVSAKIRSFDGQTAVPLVVTEINGRPMNLFFKDGETWERLSGINRDPSKDISVLLQPADIVSKFKKQLKSVRSYKDFLLG